MFARALRGARRPGACGRPSRALARAVPPHKVGAVFRVAVGVLFSTPSLRVALLRCRAKVC